MKELTLAIVGIDFPNNDRARSNRRSELMLLAPGAPMMLVPEPRNPVDPQAVAVFSPSGLQVGYLSAERAPWIGARIRAGDEVVAVLQGVVSGAGYLRVRIGGGAPTLPVGRERDEEGAGEVDFWPDPEGPEFGA
ncbi:HIRAN domain-containing protein [Sphingomonas sp. Mn802worker]|uniref:HIRAN domain-containing protein n=1 Tax=Sphingomonas sp. Mn802worker TaxID=629773 RepID=UPI00036B5A2A|nr:HIRAN domain-containing protein [Sphingomonas sp. Mn802worker]